MHGPARPWTTPKAKAKCLAPHVQAYICMCVRIVRASLLARRKRPPSLVTAARIPGKQYLHDDSPNNLNLLTSTPHLQRPDTGTTATAACSRRAGGGRRVEGGGGDRSWRDPSLKRALVVRTGPERSQRAPCTASARVGLCSPGRATEGRSPPPDGDRPAWRWSWCEDRVQRVRRGCWATDQVARITSSKCTSHVASSRARCAPPIKIPADDLVRGCATCCATVRLCCCANHSTATWQPSMVVR